MSTNGGFCIQKRLTILIQLISYCLQQNCQMECEAKIFLSYCKCILYFMPRFEDEITICGRIDEACVRHITSQIQLRKNASFICDVIDVFAKLNF